jgi:glycosyltransferase involved in cell wall biosynthesis
MLALDRLGLGLEIGAIYSPLTSLRHEHISRLRAPVHYAPPQRVLRIWEEKAKDTGKWPAALVDLHERKYGPRVKAEQRARNALYFADLFQRNGVSHFHVHFANRAAHTALFLKKISGIPFSLTAHGQDFMADLGSDDLLREICAAAEFVAAETDYSCQLLCRRCPDSAAKIHRVYNGIDLEYFRSPVPTKQRRSAPLIFSVGRLVAFKGFEYLIDACMELSRRGFDFHCEIAGDGPMRKNLQARIDKLNLSSQIALLGSLSQGSIFEKLRAADIFALASVIDSRGASDIFPTVILEAMSAARPVVSTRLAGIPELVVPGKTGLLVSPGDTAALANALERLIRDPALRQNYGEAGRMRIEQHFEIKKTIAPLLRLLQESAVQRAESPPRPSIDQIAYLIDRWPDKSLPCIERELREMEMRKIPIVPFVCELNSRARFTSIMKQLVDNLNFLPDPMALEAEWRTNRALVQKLEEERAVQENRAPSGVFLRQARFALALHRLLQEKNISHVHATSSRALVCAIALQRIANVTISAAIEPKPELPQKWIEAALRQCQGGRLRDHNLIQMLGDSFLFDEGTSLSFPARTFRRVKEKTGIGLTKRRSFWQEWARLLQRWARGRTESLTTR